MKLSLTRLTNALQNIFQASPLSLVLLGGLLFLGLDQIRSRNTFGTGAEIQDKLMLAVVMMVLVVVLISSRQKAPKRTSTTKRGGQILLIVGGVTGRFLLEPKPNPSEMIDLSVIGGIGALSLVGLSHRGSKRSDENIHQRILYLIMQGVIAVLFSILLGGGVSLSLLALESLFNVNIDGDRYATVWLSSFTILGATSFLDGLFSGNLLEERPEQIHKWKRMLARVLGFLLIVFGVILFVYMSMIIISRERPSNEVTFWAFLYSGLVIVASLILLPVRQDDDTRLYTIRQIMYATILPMCLMIGFAIYQRVEQYGITIPRYLVIAFLGWLTVMSILMIVRKHLKVRWLFASLIGVGVVSIFARPINAKTIAYRSQIDRLESIVHNTIQSSSGDQQENIHLIAQAVVYIEEDYGKILPVENIELTEKIKQVDERLISKSHIMTMDGINMYPRFAGRFGDDQFHHFYLANRSNAIDIGGYTSLYKDLFVQTDIKVDIQNENIFSHIENNMLIVSKGGEDILKTDLDLIIPRFLENPASGERSQEEMTLMLPSHKIIIQQLSLQEINGQREIQTMGFDLFEQQ